MESMALIPLISLNCFHYHQVMATILPHVLVERCGTTRPRHQLSERSAKALVVVTTKQKLDRILSDPRGQMVHGHHERSVI